MSFFRVQRTDSKAKGELETPDSKPIQFPSAGNLKRIELDEWKREEIRLNTKLVLHPDRLAFIFWAASPLPKLERAVVSSPDFDIGRGACKLSSSINRSSGLLSHAYEVAPGRTAQKPHHTLDVNMIHFSSLN